MIRAAIVGLGWWGKNLVNAVRGDDAVISFVAAHTRRADPAGNFCREHGLRWVGDFDQLLSDPTLDAVVLATPHSAHAAQVIRAVTAGKSVFVEKPFTLSVTDARRAIAAAEHAGVVLAVGFNRRFHPSMARLRQTVREGRLGTIVTVLSEQSALHGLQLTADAWRSIPEETPVGAMTQVGVHQIDGMIDLLGPIRSVSCLTAHRAAPFGGDDTTALMLSFASGAIGLVSCSVVATPNCRMAVYGTQGLAEVLGHQMGTFRLTPSADPGQLSAGRTDVVETASFNMLAAELTEFAHCVAERRPFPTPLPEILHGVEVFEAALRSAETRQPVQIGGGMWR